MSGSRGVSALAVIGGLLLLAIGALILSQSLDELALAVFGLLGLLLGLESLVLAGARAGLGRGSQARLRTDADAVTVTVTSVQAPALTVLAPLAGLATVAVASFVWSGAAWGDANLLVGVILAVLGLLSAAATASPLLRGAGPDRVDLSPASIATEHYGRRVVVPWEDVHGCVPPIGTEPLALVLRAGARPEVVARGWPMWRQPSAPDTVEPVVVRDLRIRPDLLGRVIALCAEDPAARASLGTKASLDWLTFPTVHRPGGSHHIP